jgi:hypothetical protein
VDDRKKDLIIPVVLLEDGEFSENAGTQYSDRCVVLWWCDSELNYEFNTQKRVNWLKTRQAMYV